MNSNNSSNFKAIGKNSKFECKGKQKHRYGDNTEASLRTKNEGFLSALVDFFVFRLTIML